MGNFREEIKGDLAEIFKPCETPQEFAARRICEEVASGDLRSAWLRAEARKAANNAARKCLALIRDFRPQELSAADGPLAELNGVLRKLPAEEPKIASGSNQIERHADRLAAFHWGGIEIDALKSLMVPGEEIAAVGYFVVKTSRREYSRDTLREYSRPVNFKTTERGEKWGTQFISMETLTEIERESEKGEQK